MRSIPAAAVGADLVVIGHSLAVEHCVSIWVLSFRHFHSPCCLLFHCLWLRYRKKEKGVVTKTKKHKKKKKKRKEMAVLQVKQ